MRIVGGDRGADFRTADRRIYRNSAAIVDADGSLLGVYRKMHIPDDPLFHEKYYFTPGDGHLDYHGEQAEGETGGFRVWKTRARRSAS